MTFREFAKLTSHFCWCKQHTPFYGVFVLAIRWRLRIIDHFDGLVQERRNSIALAMQLRLSCTNPSLWLLHNLHHSSAIMHTPSANLPLHETRSGSVLCVVKHPFVWQDTIKIQFMGFFANHVCYRRRWPVYLDIKHIFYSCHRDTRDRFTKTD